jgi:hypothetical protein
MNATVIVAKTRKKYNTISKMAHCNLKTGFRYVIAARKKYRKNKNNNEKYIIGSTLPTCYLYRSYFCRLLIPMCSSHIVDSFVDFLIHFKVLPSPLGPIIYTGSYTRTWYYAVTVLEEQDHKCQPN